MGGQTKRQFSAKNDATGQKNFFFRNFLFCYTSTHRDETFLFLSNFHIFSRSEKPWGEKQNVNFRLKMTPQAKKMTFFEIFFSVAHLHVEAKLFSFYQNFITSMVQRQGKALHQPTTNERTTNERRRTTWTNIIPRQDSQNPRANNNQI